MHVFPNGVCVILGATPLNAPLPLERSASAHTVDRGRAA